MLNDSGVGGKKVFVLVDRYQNANQIRPTHLQPWTEDKKA